MEKTVPKILVINAGSSTDKCFLFDMPSGQTLWEGLLDWSKIPGKVLLKASTPQKTLTETSLNITDRHQALKTLLETIQDLHGISVVGHRVVHGGDKFTQPTLITAEVKKTIQSLFPLAPLHNPPELDSINILETLLPKIPQVAVFDTAFHSTIPPFASTYPGPYQWKEEGIKRYGFHGISHSYCTKRAAAMLDKDIKKVNILSCHLGNGASIAAVSNGKSVNTSMGFTPLEGLMMGSRSGSVDPGILLYLLNQKKMDPGTLNNCLFEESGLFGICGEKDMRTVLEKAKNGDDQATLALEMYIHILRFFLCGLRASLDSLDAIVFTAGIGENSAYVRDKACKNLTFLGIQLDTAKNLACVPDQEVHAKDSHVKILVIHTREEWAIAHDCMQFIQ